MIESIRQALQPHFHVYALDQRGHGETGWTDEYAPERMIEDVAAFVGALRLDTFDLLGLSMGGRNSYGFAARHQEGPACARATLSKKPETSSAPCRLPPMTRWSAPGSALLVVGCLIGGLQIAASLSLLIPLLGAP